jgi:D-xylulose reductase
MAFCNKEITMKGSFRYGPGDYETAIQLLASGALKADELITRMVPFDQAEVAFQDVRDGKGIKTIIEGPQ